jgi:hypothetical protein
MEKLTPQNEHQEHMIQILLAKMQGLTVERKLFNDWCWSNPEDLFLSLEYRIGPKTPLPITCEMWALIDKTWNYAAMDEDGVVFFYRRKPCVAVVDNEWNGNGEGVVRCAFAINIKGINWRHSLTERPEGV